MRRRAIFLVWVLGLMVACANSAETPTPVRSSATPTALPTARVPRLHPGDLQLAANIDDIPALFADDGLFVDVAAGNEEWTAEELVIGVALNGDAHAYPIRLLSLHEIVNDTVGGQPIALTWCPLCFSAVAYDRVIDGREHTFGVSGYLYNNNLVMYDHQSNTLWSQLLGQAVRGAQRGHTLTPLPTLMTSWQAWQDAHPQTLVLSAEATDRRANDVIDPYGSYYDSGFAGLTGSSENDQRLPTQELVVGVQIGSETRTYPLRDLVEVGVINDELGDVPLLIAYDDALATAVVFDRRVGDEILTFEQATATTLRDVETGSQWQLRTGSAEMGSLQGQSLARFSAPLVYWFAWSDFHPGVEIWQP